MDLTPTEIIRCAALYYYNEDPRAQLEAARGAPLIDMHSEYLGEKIEHYRAGFCEWVNRFDRPRQKRWVDAAIERYGADVVAERVFYSGESPEIEHAESADGEW